jgi:hypothetical protein
MAIKIQGTTILDDNRNLLSGNTITATSFVGPLAGNANTVTNGVYTIGDQSIGGVKTFTGIPAFNGGVSGTSAPFTVDSTTVVTNLNADLLDGQNLVSTASTVNTVAGRDGAGDIYARLIRTTYTEDGGITSTAGVHMRVNANTDNYSRIVTGTGFVNWLENYDGAGSGLDADLLDGVQGASYLRSDADDTASGLIAFDRGAANYTDAFVIRSGAVASGNPGLFFKKADSNTVHITMWNGSTTQGSLRVTSTTTEIDSSTAIFGDDGTNGYLQLNRGNTTNPGYISFHTPNNVRRSYIGWNTSNRTSFVAENGWAWSFTGNVSFDSTTLHVDSTNNRVGIGTLTPAVSLDVSGNIRGRSTFELVPVGSEDAAVAIGQGRSANGYAYIDMIGDTTYTDYGVRIIRGNTGANASTQLIHRGTGGFSFEALDAGHLTFKTTNIERVRINSAGNVGVGIDSPSERLHVEGTARALSFASANGSASTPSFDFVADPNTGMYLAAADTIGFATNGTTAAQFTSTGNLRLFNSAGTFYTELSNSPTSNTTVTIPDINGTMSIIRSAATAGYFDTSTTTPTGTTRLNYGGYFYPTFINLAGSGDTTTAATHYFVETGTDGFVRPKTLANVRTEIVTGAAINAGLGTASPAAILHPTLIDAGSSTAPAVLRIDHQTTGTPTSGIGVSMQFGVETASTPNLEVIGEIAARTTSVSPGLEDSELIFYGMQGGVQDERFRSRSTGFTIGGIAQPQATLHVRNAIGGEFQAPTPQLRLEQKYISGREIGEGPAIEFAVEVSAGNIKPSGQIASVANDLTPGSEVFDMTFSTPGTGALPSESMRITGGGRVLINSTEAYGNIGRVPRLQVHTAGFIRDSRIGSFNWIDNNTGAGIEFYKSRSGTRGTFGVLTSGDIIGELQFYGVDSGNTSFSEATRIVTHVDAAPTTTGVPSRLSFFTSDTTGTLAERMRITSGAEVWIAGTTDRGAYNLQCNGTGVWGAGAYVNGSDARIKDNIEPIGSCKDVVNALNPITFRYKPDFSNDQSLQPGFIAQELQEALSDQPYLEGVVQGGPEYLNVAYQTLIPILTKALQEAMQEIADLKARLDAANL